MSHRVLFIPLALFSVLAVALLWQLVRNSDGDDPMRLESALIGKPLLLNVWATWCPTCRAEHRFLNMLAAQGVRIVGMNYKDDRVKAVDWLKELGNPYAMSLFDGNGMLGLDLGVYGAPETFLIDGRGIIRYRHAGDLNMQVWQETLKPLWEQYSR
ncbi:MULTISPECIES: DsbE family thiol:disulfide interchange protein [Symbiopectobacterium]|uniref:DsbE family thiol:disulfide interchange protein n=1 Tax=Symbiopectobacterium TaxID=801 RepID=UPI001A1F87E0|nr:MULTISPECIES: DsbE family thiol:disulfide interchange protein [Symbiopectobacterium]MBG6248337.1 DsbE family thiol:disulfide interchange protein [Candidatus Symbiopectobacterium sp. PLON1]MBT9430245.1 DsbE family thiol:disulfide interchange protein [Candidatus Symbiopectobacterium endolongispinus]